MKKFVSFDKFERDCLPEGKPLHQTMQENCDSALNPPEPVCQAPCVPFWQRTGEQHCLSNGLLEVQEGNGCGQTRWTRVTDPVIWVATGETRNGTDYFIENEETNQCGESRWVKTTTRWCTPTWVPATDGDPGDNTICDGSLVKRREEDGCGNERWNSTGEYVEWVPTGEAECLPGDVYRIEEQNQCGAVRWRTVPGPCPCISDWVPTGTQRCIGELVEDFEQDGCGKTRWHTTATPVAWVATGETRCGTNSLLQEKEVNQCGTVRWTNTETVCSNSPPANELGTYLGSQTVSTDYDTNVTVHLDSTTGTLVFSATGKPTVNTNWVTGAFDRNAYEARIQKISGDAYVTGSALDTWHDLGDVAAIYWNTNAHTFIGGATVEYTNNVIRLDIRKKGESISGGLTVGPYTQRATP